MISTETESLSNNLAGWKVSSVTSTEMVIDLEFARPLHVSQSFAPDMLLIYMNFSNMTDVNGVPLPDLDFKKKELPPQIGSVTEAQVITIAGKSA